jgi:hypothetical protein
MYDPYTVQQMANIRIQENLAYAEQQRLLKELAVSDRTFVAVLIERVAGWLQRMKPGIEPKRATAEIPSV